VVKFSISTAAKTQDNFNSIFLFLEVVIYNVKEGDCGPQDLVLNCVSNNIIFRRSESLSILVKVVTLVTSNSNVSITFQITTLDNVLTASMGGGRSTRSCCEKLVVPKGNNKLCPCNFIMLPELRVDCAPMSVGFQIIITCTVHAAGCFQSRRESQRYPRLYETCPVIKTCLMCNIFKCLLATFQH
jgi:hypothetical protein